MEILDVFRQDAFSTTSLTMQVNRAPYPPRFLQQLGIFTPNRIRSIDAAIMINDAGALVIVPTTQRGGPVIEQVQRPQSMRTFRTPRLALGDSIYAHELQGMLARAIMNGPIGGQDPMALFTQDLQSEIAYRTDGPNQLREKIENTKERMRLGAISGQVLDKDNSVLYDWPTLMGMALPAEIDFNLDAATPAQGDLLIAVEDIHRMILRAAGAEGTPGVRLLALCGDAFYTKFRVHNDVYKTYLNTADAGTLRNALPFASFVFGNIEWINYRGSDDGSTIGIDTNKCKFIPVGIPGLFQEVLAPGESFEFANTPGQDIYVILIPDRDRNQFVRVEVYSYPMYIATRPDLLFSGRLT